MKITIGEIAKMAGVTKSTVSRVVNNKQDVNPETRKRVQAIIAKYDFQPNALAKAIMLQKSNHVGLLIPHETEFVFSDQFYTEVMRGVSTEVDQRGYYLTLCYAHAVNYLDIYRQKLVDGFILLSPGYYHKTIIKSLEVEKVPYISTSKIADDDELVFVDIDHYSASMLVTEHLAALGHSRIAYIGKPTVTHGLASGPDRMRGFKDSLAKNGIPCIESLIKISNSSTPEGGYETTLNILQNSIKPTAIYVAEDVMAIGCLRALLENGIKVPDDISVVGFDDIPIAKNIYPTLTTVRQPSYEKGVQAARILINSLEANEPPKSTVLEAELIIRNSTGSPNRSQFGG